MLHLHRKQVHRTFIAKRWIPWNWVNTLPNIKKTSLNAEAPPHTPQLVRIESLGSNRYAVYKVYDIDYLAKNINEPIDFVLEQIEYALKGLEEGRSMETES